jgi:hypothetical protein
MGRERSDGSVFATEEFQHCVEERVLSCGYVNDDRGTQENASIVIMFLYDDDFFLDTS